MTESSVNACPAHDLLEQFRRGLLPDSDLERLADHVAACRRCSAELAKAAAGDPTLVLLRRSLRQTPLPDEEASAAIAARVRRWEELGGTANEESAPLKGDLGFLTSRGSLAIADACELVRQAAVAAAGLHARGVVHRDIKPDSLILGTDGAVKLLDARPAAPKNGGTKFTSGWHLVGTPDYVAPEQIIVADNAGPAADVYSLGCTLFKLLTGRAPFEDARHPRTEDKLRAHSLQTPPDLRAARRDVPPALAALVTALLAKYPTERGTAAELAEALAPFANGHCISKLLEPVHGPGVL
jgi:hypothetical protein